MTNFTAFSDRLSGNARLRFNDICTGCSKHCDAVRRVSSATITGSSRILYRPEETFLSSHIGVDDNRFSRYDGAHGDGEHVHDICAAYLWIVQAR